ncbi:MAG: hypothetical protein U5K76_12955 [Woeseiaceae bacterium]|nr:hypothetical protein [Woeseiaceae bacterium]
MTRTNRLLLTCALSVLGITAGCATANTPSPDTRSANSCPSGQILVCKGSDANSRVKDSRLNQKDICICREAN